MPKPRILAFVLAGGEGRRLRPLTEDRAKPAVELGQGYRIVDFVLANLVNSGVRWIYLLAQYKPAALIEHVARVWRPQLIKRGCLLHPLVAQPASDEYKGTADAVYRHLDLVARHEPDVVAVFAADHVYRMDVRQMVEFHLRRDADVTVAATRIALAEARRFGVLRAGVSGRMEQWHEKPAQPAPIPDDPRCALVSMGNYLFEPVALCDLLQDAIAKDGHDFGRDVLPRAVHRGASVFAYDFSSNRVPGVKPHEEPAYWRDVGTMEALAGARRDIQGPSPRFDLRNGRWPLHPQARTSG
jgi:glucose-1-phosphate adenylyltransferase